MRSPRSRTVRRPCESCSPASSCLRHEEEQAKKELAGDVKASWGDQMRSYVLQPYQMVKDLRTEYESGNPQSVFDGDIDGFINAGIRWRKNEQKAAQD